MPLREIRYDYPEAAYLLLFVAAFVFLYTLLFRYRRTHIEAYTSPKLQPKLLVPRSSLYTIAKIVCLNIAWIAACLALMGPKGNLQYQSFQESGAKANQSISSQGPNKLRYRTHEIYFLIDTSASMSVPDARLGQTRLQDAKEIAEEIVRQLRGENVALYAFTSVLSSLSPPTVDYLFVRLELTQMKINEGDVEGTDFKKVFEELNDKLTANSSPSKLYTVILFSDGGDNQLEKSKGAAREERIHQILKAFAYPSDLDLRLFTIGIGSKSGGIIPNVTFAGKQVHSNLEEDILEQLAAQNRGNSYEANEWPTWNLAHDLMNKIAEDSPYEREGEGPSMGTARQVIPAKREEISYDLYYQFPLGCAIALLCIYFLLPDVRRL